MKARYNSNRISRLAQSQIGIEVLVDEQIINLSDGGLHHERWCNDDGVMYLGWVHGKPEQFEQIELFEFILPLNEEWYEVPPELEEWILKHCGTWEEIAQRASKQRISDLEKIKVREAEFEARNLLFDYKLKIEAQCKGFNVSVDEVGQTQFWAYGAQWVNNRKKEFRYYGTVPELIQAWENWKKEISPLKSGKPKPKPKPR